jgi:hypothetical protein
MVEIEAAANNFEAQARLDEIRSQMGIETAAPAVEAPAPETATATEPPAEPTPQASPGS